jgi:hypothetical protein
VRRLIAGPNSVYICDECVLICLAIVSEDRTDASPAEAHDASSSWREATLGFCALCGLPTSADQALSVRTRGLVCSGCLGEIEAAIAEPEIVQNDGP